MKRFITTLFLISLYVTIISNIVYAQLPFGPFAADTGNPVVPATPGTWDQDAVLWPSVIFVNDTFYMTYVGTNDFPDTAVAIGLATSPYGYIYTKDLNPIISGDGTGFDAYDAGASVLWYDDPNWYIYYSSRSTPPSQLGNVIGRAMSTTSPHGPWIRSDDTLLTVGSPGEWDSEFICPESIIKNGSELIMYYLAGDTWPAIPQIGMATSTDGGLTWEKYNDPTTTSPPYAESDPVLKPDRPYDMLGIWGCTVLRRNTLWEMFYSGSAANETSISYATSLDGINWIKDRDSLNNPIFTPSQDPIATGIFEKPSVVIIESLYFMYYDYGTTGNGIGLATAENLIVPGININPVELDFGGVAIDTFATMTFTIMNTGNADLEITDISSNEPAFAVNIITSITVPPGNDQDVEVTFTPTEVLAYNGVIEIVHNALGSPDSVAVIGNGIPTGIEDEMTLPVSYKLYQNYPNPFNPATFIEFALPNTGFVTLSIVNILGEQVATLVSENLTAGSYKYEWDASELTSGIYFYQLRAGSPSTSSGQSFVETKKMILLK